MRFFKIAIVLSLLVLVPTTGLAQQTQQPVTATAKKKLQFETWRTINLGTINLGTGFKTANEFRRALNYADGFHIGKWGDDILGEPAFKVSETVIQVDLVNVSVDELSFKHGATRADIYKRALEFGLELCPNEVGPQLRLQYKDQPEDGGLLIAMEPVTILGNLNNLFVFRIGHGLSGLWLHGDDGDPDLFWPGHSRWVFVRPRK